MGVQDDLVIWGRIALAFLIFLGPNCLTIFLVRRDRKKCDIYKGNASIRPHYAMLFLAVPIVVLCVGLIWALAVTGYDVLPIHAIAMVGMIFLIFCLTRHIGPKWCIDWTDELLEGPRQLVYFSSPERVSARWNEIIAIREKSKKIFLETENGGTITFDQSFRGYLTFLRAIYCKCPNIQDVEAPQEWFLDEVRTPDK